MIPVLIAAAARMAPMLAARVGAGAAAEGAAAEGGMLSRVAGAASKMPVGGGGGNEPRKANFDASRLSGGGDMASMNFQPY